MSNASEKIIKSRTNWITTLNSVFGQTIRFLMYFVKRLRYDMFYTQDVFGGNVNFKTFHARQSCE